MKAINAENLKNWIKRRCNPYGKPDLDYDTSLEIMSMINQMDNLDKWIDTEDGKPEDGVYVFVVLKYTYESDYTDYSVARYIELSDGNSYWYDNKHGYLEHPIYTDGNGGSSLYKVVAWKPIEPYKED